ncbi:hypothetical protein LAJ19_10115 [Deinococcus taeanensis]|uniref:hypothetical protein n=1 Tax=Deinococcus taeanensis TaxID=2737050 RepID=UPI001CDB5347|nr:hypothetical protein [Deinococcus taeanensis]UBV41993.1 hypothetical protein LAJ19_10115 [Deinococcus taeanensis]
MIVTLLLVGLLVAAAISLLRSALNDGGRYSGIPKGPGRHDAAQDVYWEARVLAVVQGNRAALERHVLAKQRQKPGLKRWQLLRLVYLDLRRRHPERRPAPRAGVFRTHF